MRRHFNTKRMLTALMVASLSMSTLSTTALADTSTAVEISDQGPLAAGHVENSQGAVGNVLETTAAAGTTTETAQSSIAGNVTTAAQPGPSVPAGASAGTTATVGSASGTTSATTQGSAQSTNGNASTGTTQAGSTAISQTLVGSSSTGTTNYFQQQSSSFLRTAMTITPEVNANFAILVDADANLVVADKNGTAKMYPASMTKVMTLLVACEHISNLNEKVEITQDIVDYVQKEGASHCGFKAGEQVSVQDLLYGLILPSGADAALALVRHIAGSEEQFVALMNQKAQQLGIAGPTHFTNTTGLYDDNHYSTAQDLAVIMRAASQNSMAATILTTRSYTTQPNNKRSTGLSFSNLFLKRIDTQTTGGQVNFAKTGYVAKAGNCAVSYFTAASGKHYICVTGKTSGAWNVVYAHAALYKQYAK